MIMCLRVENYASDVMLVNMSEKGIEIYKDTHLSKSVGLCKTTKRKDQLYISLLGSVWRIICENFNPNGLILAEIWMKI